MIHVATVHWNSADWIDLQLNYLRRHVREEYRVWACLEGIDDFYAERFDVVVPAAGPHAGKLNLLAYHISDVADPADLIMFLDGDAFPISDVMSVVTPLLHEVDLVAIRRDENLGDRQPHPSFCMTSVAAWRRLRGDWLSGFGWTRPDGTRVTDVGGNLLCLLESSGMRWSPLLRTHQLGEHPVWFGVYGSAVYHHGAGFRPSVSRWDERARPSPVLAGGERLPAVGRVLARHNRRRQERWERARTDAVASISADVRRRVADPRTFEDVLGGRAGRVVEPRSPAGRQDPSHM